ncbi:acid phosphatase [Moniliophthora roreri]|nr:acid phosphatase [Moniliophthora roreri]
MTHNPIGRCIYVLLRTAPRKPSYDIRFRWQMIGSALSRRWTPDGHSSVPSKEGICESDLDLTIFLCARAALIETPRSCTRLAAACWSTELELGMDRSRVLLSPSSAENRYIRLTLLRAAEDGLLLPILGPLIARSRELTSKNFGASVPISYIHKKLIHILDSDYTRQV